MPSQLLVNVLSVTVPAGAYNYEVAHGLRSNDRAVAPTLILPIAQSVVQILSADETNLYLFNPSGSDVSVTFRCERGLSNELDAETVIPFFQNIGDGIIPPPPPVPVQSVSVTAPITNTGTSENPIIGASVGSTAGTLCAGDDPRLVTTIAQVYYVTANGNNTTGNGSIAKPFASVQKAHDVAATTYTGGEFVQIIVGPGTYSTGLSITRLNTFIIGSGPRPEDQGTKLMTSISVSLPSGGSTFNNQIAISGCFIQSSFGSAAVQVGSNGNYTLTLTDCYLTATNPAASAQAFMCLNENIKVVIQNCTLTTQGASAAPVMYLQKGDIKVQSCQVQNAVGSTGRMALIEANAYVFFDSVLFENNTTNSAISVSGTQPGAAPYKLLVSNSSITAPLSSGVVINAAGTTSIVTSSVFTINAAQDIITATAGTVVYGSLTSTPTYSTTISGAGATPYSETHATLYLPALGAGALTKNTATGAVTAVAPSFAGNALTSDGANWVSSPYHVYRSLSNEQIAATTDTITLVLGPFVRLRTTTASYTLVSTPSIVTTGVQKGTVIYIQNDSASFSVTLQKDSAVGGLVAGTKLNLIANVLTINPNEVYQFIFDGTYWNQVR